MNIRGLSSRLLNLGLTGFLSISCGGINSSLEDFVDDSCSVDNISHFNSNNSFDYCILSETSNPVDQLMAGNSVSYEILFEGDLDVIKSLTLGKDNVSFIQNSILDSVQNPFKNSIKDKDYKILLVPVGYDDSKSSRLATGYFAEILTQAFKGVNVSFSYFDTSVPISIEHVERLLLLSNVEEAKILHDKINTFYHTDGLAILLNSSEYLGSGGEYPIFSTENPNSLYLAIHEIGHKLGLGDGYKRYYSPRELDGRELFVTSKYFGADVWEAFKNIQPPIKFTGNHCKCLPVFTYYEEEDVMDKSVTNFEFLDLLKEEKSPFNPFQIELMNIRIRNALDKTKK